ncbi:hypothetical protein A2774_04315 [Candidatus Roizmanbacteria bacterium RIFCSPHIGHO2_01_FULL_39_12c]|uniref:Glycosyltransferase RgtA/B/C/D-like domain-containing protein n=1 Tax=Candidatus Roizmanbacteria bacterium RIFCSPHIGHO2_01_FULL_39_12c TaxID=1802031 RepID=A0A1F7G9E3_9BACT|nr:MAG: hypothetical protein A2774_04315 [Candidatus Roizmanbacteria bacterium RIFCSPHIGHO2_01_FULL_39_12c]OGK47806.1 MAG: hypothetical protein A2963_03055 [Candidatus Roizmanbacteria bacterium RIFCSPLOWO2_01_FULL_40_13]
MKSAFDYSKKHKILLLVILPAFLLYMLIIFPSGTFFCFKAACGINFWGVHGHDGIWHLAIANVAFNKFPFVAPTFSGENLYGYNYLLDLFIFLLSKAGIPAIVSYFKILPAIWFILFTCLLIILARMIKNNPKFVGFFLFFNYFAGSFYYLIKLYHEGSINDSSTQIPQPAMIMMSNPPFAYSLLLILWILILLKDKEVSLKKFFLISFCLFLIIGLKFYAGAISVFLVVAYVMLFIPGMRIKLKYLFIICLFVIGGILLFYDPLRSLKTGAIFGFAPFALVHTITESPNMVYLQNLTDARYFLIAHGIGPRLIAIETLNLAIFLFFYLGTRFFGLFYLAFLLLKKQLGKFDFAVILAIVFSILLTVTLVQKAEWWNTIQFFYYSIFLLTIYLSRLSFDLWNSKNMALKAGVIAIILLSIPTTFDMTKFFRTAPGATYVSKSELDALKFLSKQPDGVVLTSLYNKKWKDILKTGEIFAYEDTAYVAAFTGKQLYLANILQLRLTGVSYEDRLTRVKDLDCSVLNEVDYVYEVKIFPDGEKIMARCSPKNAKKIYENSKTTVYSVKNSL